MSEEVVVPRPGSLPVKAASPGFEESPPPQPGVEGWVDGWEAGLVKGWAASAAGSQDPVEVELLIDGEPVARAPADRFRDDLAASEIGSGHHAFELVIPERAFDNRPHEWLVRDVNGRQPLRGTPALMRRHALDRWSASADEGPLRRREIAEGALAFVAALPDADLEPSMLAPLAELSQWLGPASPARLRRLAEAQLNRITALRLRVGLDGLGDAAEVSGVVHDDWFPGEPLTLEWLLDGQVAHTTTFDAAAGSGGGRRFAFALPVSARDGGIHRLSVRPRPHGGCLGPWSLLVPTVQAEAAAPLPPPLHPLWQTLPAAQARRRRVHKTAAASDVIELARRALQDAIDDLADARHDVASAPDREREVRDRQVALARALLQAGRASESRTFFEALLEKDEADVDAVVGLVRCLVAAGAVRDARKHLDDALQRLPDERALHGLADELVERRHASQCRVIAFYLPQFHPTPENDRWWGKGFVEWHNVAAATPMFEGHLQPRRPTSLGYYDLRLPDAANAQFELARRYGIDGFCYYYYWFEGRRVLHKPLDDLAAGRTGPFPFCICWANEDWTRSWDGSTGEVLLAQNHSPEGDFEFIRDLAPLLRHRDYIRVDGRPMVIVYRADRLATPRETVQRWREWCRESGIGELYLCAVQSFGFHDPRPLGFDAAVEFPPHCPWERYPDPPYLQTPRDLPERVPGFAGIVYDYPGFARAATQRPREPFALHRTAMAAWDNTARRGKSAAIYHGFGSEVFERWVRFNAQRALVEQADPVCFVNAWNEWAEGSVLEPDAHFGYQLLESVRRARLSAAVCPVPTYWRHGAPALPEDRLEDTQRVLLIGHDAFPSGAQINMLHMARTLKRELGMNVSLMLVEGGELLAEYERVAETYVIGQEGEWREALVRRLQRLAALGARKAICNTVVTGDVCEVLKQQGFRVVGLLHELGTLIESNGLQDRCWRFAEHADAIVAASSVVADDFVHRYWPRLDKLLIAPQGIVFNRYEGRQAAMRAEVRAELGLHPDSLMVLGCGYGDTRKGIDLFVQLAGGLASDAGETPLAFVWVGAVDSTMEPYLKADIERLRIGRQFRFTGRSADAARYFAAGDLFALTSREDPFPSVVMEAFDARMPVLAFEGGGGYVDLVGPDSGALVPYLNVPAMVAAAAALLKDEPRRRAVGERNHALARERFGYAPYMRKLLALLAGTSTAQVAAGALRPRPWAGPGPRPSITAIVPNYNYARYLELRLRTVAFQTLPPDEIIVLDDASTDGSLELIRDLATVLPVPVHVIAGDRNSGNPFVQWCKGLERASGDLVWIAEADDYCEPTLLETLAREFTDPKVVLAWTDSVMVDDAGHSEGGRYHPYYASRYGSKWTFGFRMPGRELIEDCLFTENVVPNASAALFRRSAVSFDLEPLRQYRFSGDWWFWLFLARAGDVVYTADAQNYHRRHGRSVMGEVLRSGEALLAETLAFHVRFAQAAPDAVCARSVRQALARVAELAARFPELGDGAQVLATNPRLAGAYRELGALHDRLAATNRGTALLVVSEDALREDGRALELVSGLAVQHRLQVAVLGGDASTAWIQQAAEAAPGVPVLPLRDEGRASATLPAEGDAAPASGIAELLTRFDSWYSYGLRAHCVLADVPPQGAARWTVLAGREFDALLGQPPRVRGVSVRALRRAVTGCAAVRYVDAQPSHPFARMAQSRALPMDRLVLPPPASAIRRSGSGGERVLLGLASQLEPGAWERLADALEVAEGRLAAPVRLRVVGWGSDLASLWSGPVRARLEPVALYDLPAAWEPLADGIIRCEQSPTHKLPTLPASSLPVVALPVQEDEAAWLASAVNAIADWVSQHAPPAPTVVARDLHA